MSDVVIIGGGLGGLAAALALAREDIRVTVLEAGARRPVDHFGYTLWPPGTRVLEWLGLLDEVAAEGCRLQTLRWYNQAGREWASLQLAPLGELGRFVGVRPSRVVAALRAATERAGVRLIDRAGDWKLERTRPGWTVRLKGEALRCEVVIGSDGPRSRVRECMGVPNFRWLPPRQRLITGIGGALGPPESRQAMGTGWSGGCVSLGSGGSWLYAIVNGDGTGPDDACAATARSTATRTAPSTP
jgi:2-octaprenyl-6-methoxyphenol hydroxylase